MTDEIDNLVVVCPEPGSVQPVPFHGKMYYLSLGYERGNRGPLLAIVTLGHPNVGAGQAEVLACERVETEEEAAEFFQTSMNEMPWEKRS